MNKCIKYKEYRVEHINIAEHGSTYIPNAKSNSIENNFKNAIAQLIIDNKNNYIDSTKVKEILEE